MSNSEKRNASKTLSVSNASALPCIIRHKTFFYLPPLSLDLHYQQRTTRKCITIIQGLQDDLDDKKLCRAFKKMFHCNGTVVEDEEKGMIIQLQGDFRKDVALFFVEEGIATKEGIKIHGIWRASYHL